LVWAAGYNLTAMPLAAMGWVPPWAAAIGMSMSSIVVVLNSLRLIRSGRPHAAPGAAPQPRSFSPALPVRALRSAAP
jgi:Cu2+-exporting ATPase